VLFSGPRYTHNEHISGHDNGGRRAHVHER
jgi:hypothetical protein